MKQVTGEKADEKDNLFSFVLTLVLAAASSVAFAQKATDSEIQIEKDLALLRRDLRSERKRR